MGRLYELYEKDKLENDRHFMPRCKDSTNFKEDETTHSVMTLLFTYGFMGACWAGKSGMNIKEMAFACMGCVFMGIMIILCEGFHLPTYIARFAGVFTGALIILSLNNVFVITTEIPKLMVALIMPVATGMMVVDGMYAFTKGLKKEGVKKVIVAVLCSVALGGAVFLAGIITGNIK